MLDGTYFKILPVTEAWSYRGQLTVSAGESNTYNWSQVSPYPNSISWSANGATVDVYSRFENKSITLQCTATAPCGNSSSRSYSFVTGDMLIPLLSIFPNPSTTETTISIEQGSTEGNSLKSASVETTFDQDAEWDLEVYDSMQSLKLKKQKLKGGSATINTQSWKEGVYMVRVKYKDEMLIGKLVVNK